MPSRPEWHQHFLNIATEVSKMSTCARRSVGCVLVDQRHRILATGFNGTPPKWPHCKGDPQVELVVRCPGADAESGTSLDLCYANHAEINALITCQHPNLIYTCYCTTSPCVSCVKALLCTSTVDVVFLEDYSQPEASELWLKRPLTTEVDVLRNVGHIERTWRKYGKDGYTKRSPGRSKGRTGGLWQNL